MKLNYFDSSFGILIHRELREETNPDIIKGLKRAMELYEESGHYSLSDLLDEEDGRDELEEDITEIAEKLQWKFLSKGKTFTFIKEGFRFSITAEIGASRDEIAETIANLDLEDKKLKKEILVLSKALEE